jgi:hypothetical protein
MTTTRTTTTSPEFNEGEAAARWDVGLWDSGGGDDDDKAKVLCYPVRLFVPFNASSRGEAPNLRMLLLFEDCRRPSTAEKIATGHAA